MKSNSKRNKRRLERYKALISVGYNSRQANKFKDYSKTKIEALLDSKRKHNKDIQNIAKGV